MSPYQQKLFIDIFNKPFGNVLQNEMSQDAENFFTLHKEVFQKLATLFTHVSITRSNLSTLIFIISHAANLTSLQLFESDLYNKEGLILHPKNAKRLQYWLMTLEGKSLEIDLKNYVFDFEFLKMLPNVPFKKLTIRFKTTNIISTKDISKFGELKTGSLIIEHKSKSKSNEPRTFTYNIWDLLQLQEKLPKTEIHWVHSLIESKKGSFQFEFKTAKFEFEKAKPYQLSDGSLLFMHVNSPQFCKPLTNENLLPLLKITPFRDNRDFQGVVTSSRPNNCTCDIKTGKLVFRGDPNPLLSGMFSKINAFFSFSNYASDKYVYQNISYDPTKLPVPYDQNILDGTDKSVRLSPILSIDGRQRRLAISPTKENAAVFLNTLFTDNVGLVVVLTNTDDFHYWPENVGDIKSKGSNVLSCNSLLLNLPHATLRQITMKNQEATKTFFHLHIRYDEKISLLENGFLECISGIISIEKGLGESTTWIHCNDGGKSGLLLACTMIDSSIDKIKSRPLYLDPERLLLSLHTQRPHVIQSKPHLQAILNFFPHQVKSKEFGYRAKK